MSGRRLPRRVAALAALAVLSSPALAASQVTLACEAVYQPSREVWVRTVRIDHDQRRITAVTIDGAPVFQFQVEGTVLATGLDNERIRIDTAALTWESDFRGMAQSQGRCERTP